MQLTIGYTVPATPWLVYACSRHPELEIETLHRRALYITVGHTEAQPLAEGALSDDARQTRNHPM